MNRLIIDLDTLQLNIEVIDGWMKQHGASWTLTTKVLCGHADALHALQRVGVRSMADSRLRNLRQIERIVPDFEAWYLRLPHMSAIDDIVALSDVSLNTEREILEALDVAARKRGTVHRVVIMIELGDLREGILPGDLIDFYEHTFSLENIEVLGIGANQGCLSGAVPDIDQINQLVLYKELLELKFQRRLPMISGGSSSLLPLLLEGRLNPAVNHFRIGEAVFLGTDLVNGGTLPGLRDDAFTLEAEIVELKEKNLIPLGDTSLTMPFERFDGDDVEPGSRGYRALITMGQLDTDMNGLSPVVDSYRVAGASSDVSVVNIADNPNRLSIGDTISFRPSYGALLRLMLGPYVEKVVTPSIGDYEVSREIELPAVVPESLEHDG